MRELVVVYVVEVANRSADVDDLQDFPVKRDELCPSSEKNVVPTWSTVACNYSAR